MALVIEQISPTKIWIHDGPTSIMEIDTADGVRINSTVKFGTDIISPSASELAALDGLTASATELNKLAGVSAGAVSASKAAVLGTNKELDEVHAVALYTGAGAGTLITPTAAKINKLAQGVAGDYMIARSAAPVALDGSNPTSVAHGLTTCVAAFAQLVGSDAPGDSTMLLTAVINGANIDVYAWKHTDGTDPTLVASTGTETFNWFAIGT
jgi:hypothetical protein